MSRRAELFMLWLRYIKKRHGHSTMPIPEVRRRLRLIEHIVPFPPAGTLTKAIDAGGVDAVHIAVPQSRTDRCVLYFHGGGYVLGSAPLYRDFLWRIAVAAHACVLYFDYRLRPSIRSPPRSRMPLRYIAGLPLVSTTGGLRSWEIPQAAACRLPPCTSCATKALPCPAPSWLSRPGPTSHSPGRRCARMP